MSAPSSATAAVSAPSASPSASDPSQPTYDLLTIGFGPASLAIAIALAEYNSGAPCPNPPAYSSLGGLQAALGFSASQETGSSAPRRRPLRTCFLEKQERFRWHPGMMLEGSSMQISFLKDLATMRNPQSAYTFLSYLASFSPSRLASFISLSTFTPSRREFADYLQWCAEKVQGETEQQGGTFGYGEEVVAVEALTEDALPDGEVRLLRVSSRNGKTGSVTHRLARNLVVSTGGYARLPPQLTTPDLSSSGRILHTSSFVERIDPILSSIASAAPSSSRPIRIAVVGAGQSAAECFLALRSKLAARLPDGLAHRPQLDMIFKKSAPRPTDEGQFSNEVFDPSMSQAMYRLPEEHRERVLAEAKGTNYSIVNPKVLEALYGAMYAQKLEEDIAGRSAVSATDLTRDPKLNLHPLNELLSASLSPTSSILLTTYNSVLCETREVEYDAIVCGTGYDRQGWRHILFPSSAPSSSDNAVPLSALFGPARDVASSVEHNAISSPAPVSPLSTPPTLNLPETAFTLPPRRTLHASETPEGSSSSRAPSSERDSHASSPHTARSTAASSPPSPGSPSDKRATQGDNAYKVAENYRLVLPEKTAQGGAFRPTVWLQGSCEKTHGISDSLLSVLAVRSGEVVRSLLREGNFADEA